MNKHIVVAAAIVATHAVEIAKSDLEDYDQLVNLSKLKQMTIPKYELPALSGFRRRDATDKWREENEESD